MAAHSLLLVLFFLIIHRISPRFIALRLLQTRVATRRSFPVLFPLAKPPPDCPGRIAPRPRSQQTFRGYPAPHPRRQSRKSASVAKDHHTCHHQKARLPQCPRLRASRSIPIYWLAIAPFRLGRSVCGTVGRLARTFAPGSPEWPGTAPARKKPGSCLGHTGSPPKSVWPHGLHLSLTCQAPGRFGWNGGWQIASVQARSQNSAAPAPQDCAPANSYPFRASLA